MSIWRNCFKRYRAISWVVVTALLIQMLFPLSFHLHHDVSPVTAGHDHVIDSHLLSDNQVTEHLADEDTQELKTTMEAIVKQGVDTGLVFILFVCLLTLMSTVLPIVNHLWQTARNSFSHFFYYVLAPPLRAPPAI
jgi:pheromone shutdown protein TraB